MDYTTKIEDSSDLSKVCKAVKGNFNVLKLEHDPVGGIDGIYMHANVKNQANGNRHAEFTTKISIVTDDYYHVKMVQDAGISFDRLEMDFVNYVTEIDDRQLTIREEAVVFFDTLYDFPEIKEIKLVAHYISEASDMFSAHDPVMLRSLKICDAEVTQDALECVGCLCPVLKELILLNCPLGDGRDNIFQIRMGKITLDSFVYMTVPVRAICPDNDQGDNDKACAYIENSMNYAKKAYSKDTYLWLGILKAGKTLYFKIIAGQNSNQVISKEVFESRPEESPVTRISCYSIKSLIICVDSTFISLQEAGINNYLNSPLAAPRQLRYEWR